MSMRVAWARWYWIVIFTTCAARTASDWLDCVHISACACKWSSGKKTALCASSDLRRPPALSSDIQVLDIHDNPLRSLPQQVFANIELINLQKINLRATKLRSIHVDAFLELRILIEVDLADNDLSSLPKDIFRGNERLRLVVLSNNPLTTLVANQFPPLPHLRMLLLDGCRLRSIHTTAFRNLKSLETLDLRRNQITFLRVNTVSLPALKMISLSGNPWRCDCRLQEFKEWFQDSKLGNEELLCVEPSTQAGKKWKNVDRTTMTCAPEVRSSTLVVRAEVGVATSFGCWVHGVPTPKVTWLFDGIDVHNSTVDNEMEVVETEITDDSEDRVSGSVRWVNITLMNVTSSSAGEWTCLAQSVSGEARAIISVVLPRLQTATARTAPGIPQVLGVVFGALGVLASLGCIAAVACWRMRRHTVPPSRSFTDQEKRLIDASVVVSCDRSIGDVASPCDFELTRRSLSIDEQARGCGFDPVHITIEGTPGAFPPPPAEFAVPVPYGNIFISVQVASRGESGKYPDLLSGGATLPRRNRTCCGGVPAYDNMGPRVTAAGSSTWSLPGASSENNEVSETPVLTLPPPPPEFVSL